MQQVIQQAKDIWNRLPMAGRITTIVAAVATVGLLSAVIYLGSQSEYGVLFSNLKPAEAQTIVEKLKSANVPYSLTDNGTTVRVPTDKISELRIQMASEGVLSGGHVGFDLFDQTNFGATDFAQQVNYRRAIEGELARTLEGMDEVEQARVHITPKKESVFTDKEEGAKASVMLRVQQGKKLSSERTEAIVSLISSSVASLDPSNVSVMDTRGRLLTSAGMGKDGIGDAGTFSSQLDAKRKFEMETAARVVSLIEPIVGSGRVRADVSADVDFSKIEQTEEKYNPQSQVVRSQTNSEETKNNTSTSPARNIVGARGNDPTAPQNQQNQVNQQTGNNRRVTQATKYEIDKTVKHTVGGGGRVNRMNVSVVVDYKNANNTQVARTADELAKLEKLVAAAVGTDEERGDSVVVQTMAFDQSNFPADAPAATFLENNKQLITTATKYGLLVLAVLLVLFFVIRPAKKAIKLAAKPEDEPKLLEGNSEKDEENSGEKTDEKRMLPEEEKEKLQDKEQKILTDANTPMTVAEIEAKLEQDELEENLENAMVTADKDPVKQLESVKSMLVKQDPEQTEIVVGTLRSWLRN